MIIRRYAHLDTLTPALDAQNIAKVLSFLTDDCLFQAGNTPILIGKMAISNQLRGFYQTVRAVQHQVQDIFEGENRAVYHGFVTYTRLDGSTLRIPVCDVFMMTGEKVAGYYIYVDWSAL
ncbi:nuclear transport factor 2 family protein [Spirosoma arcticum]